MLTACPSERAPCRAGQLCGSAVAAGKEAECSDAEGGGSAMELLEEGWCNAE